MSEAYLDHLCWIETRNKIALNNKCHKVIMSCESPKQLAVAKRYVDLADLDCLSKYCLNMELDDQAITVRHFFSA